MKVTPSLLQIDLQNLSYKGQRLDLEIIWDHFNERANEFLTDAIVYMIRDAEFDSSKFEAKIKNMGFNICIKTTQKAGGIEDAYQQAFLNLALDAVDRIDSYERLILMSGNGAFGDLCSFLKKKGKKIEIWGFRNKFDSSLEMYADRMNFIPQKFFLKKPRITVFGFNTNERLS